MAKTLGQKPFLTKFPVVIPVSRDFRTETVSITTASSASDFLSHSNQFEAAQKIVGENPFSPTHANSHRLRILSRTLVFRTFPTGLFGHR